MVPLLTPSAFSQAMARLAVAPSVASHTIQQMPMWTVRLSGVSARPAITSTQILFRSHFFQVCWVLAWRIAAKMVGMLAAYRPLARCQEQGDSMGRRRTMEFLYPDMPVASRIARTQPRPAFIRPALVHLRPVAFFERLRLRAMHGCSIAYWYE